VWLFGTTPDGRPWDAGRPVCRSSGRPDLLVVEIAPLLWQIVTDAPPDARVRCSAGTAEASVRWAWTEGVPARLDLRVWPEDLPSDDPMAVLGASVLDPRGEPLVVSGVTVTAERGRVAAVAAEGTRWRAEFDGTAAVASGSDRLRARYDRAPGDGPLGALVLGHGASEGAGPGGDVRVHARALDLSGRPLVGVEIAVTRLGDAAAAPASGITGPDGWVAMAVPIEPGARLVAVEARSGARLARAVWRRDAPPVGGPGSPDLSVDREIRFSTGDAGTVAVRVEPGVLYAGPRAVARVEARVVDRGGAPVPGPPDPLTASEGTVSPWTVSANGSWTAEFFPAPGGQARDVELVVRSGAAATRASLHVEPRPIDRSALFGAGGITNFAAIRSPYLTVDLDFRTALLRRNLLFRFGLGWYGAAAAIDVGLERPARLRERFLPVTLAWLTRGEYRGNAFWGGLGTVVVPHASEIRFGAHREGGWGLYPPGLSMVGGVGRRVFRWGELVFELRATAIASQGGDFGFTGPVGGLSGVAGYRVIY
jgi:hypothetical protein